MAGENALTAQAPVQCLAHNDRAVYCAALPAATSPGAQEPAPHGFFMPAARWPDLRCKALSRGLQVEGNRPALVRIRA